MSGPSVFGVSFGFASDPNHADVEPLVPDGRDADRPVESLVAIRVAQRTRPAPRAALREAVADLLSSSRVPLGPPLLSGGGGLSVGTAPVALDARLLLTTASGSRIMVEAGGTAMIGRLPDCDVLIDDPSISRRHCCVSASVDSAGVRDLGSSNGTWINRGGARVPVPAGLGISLLDNDWLFAGDVPLVHVTVVDSPS